MTTRRVIVYALALAAWFAVDSLDLAGAAGAQGEALGLAGLVLLGALVLAEVVRSVGAPALLGYVSAGLIAGPITGALDPLLEMAGEPLQMGAIALMALAAGLSLPPPGNGTDRRGWLTASLVMIAVAVTGVAAVAWVALPLLPAVSGVGEWRGALALLIGVVLAASSPIVAATIVRDAKAEGPLSQFALGGALTRGLLLLLVLAAVAPIVGASAGTVLATAGWTLIAGGLLAGVLVVIAPIAGFGALLPIALLAIASLPLVTELRAEVALTFLFAGALARTYAPQAARDALTSVSEAVHAVGAPVLFTLLGAAVVFPLDVGTLLLIITLYLARTGSLYAGSALAGRLLHGPAAIGRDAWLVAIPQAEIALGLTAVASTLVPGPAPALTSIVGALVCLHLVIGSITLKVGLRRAGELATELPGADPTGDRADAEASEEASGDAEGHSAAFDPLSALAGPDDPAPHRAWRATVQSVVHLRSRVREQAVMPRLARLAAVVHSVGSLARQSVHNASEAVGRASDEADMLECLDRARDQLAEHVRVELDALQPPALAVADEEGARGDGELPPGLLQLLSEEVEPVVRSSAAELDVAEGPRHVTWTADDASWVRAGKRVKAIVRRVEAFLGRPAARRVVPYRRITRRVLAGELVAGLGPVEAMIARAEFKALRRIEGQIRRADDALVAARSRIAEGATSDELREWMHERVGDLRDSSREAQADVLVLAEEPMQRVSEALATALHRIAHMADVAGTFQLRETALRFSAVAPQVRAAIAEARVDRQRWAVRQQAQIDRLRLMVTLIELQGQLRDVVLRKAVGPAVRMHTRLVELMRVARDRVASAKGLISAGPAPAEGEEVDSEEGRERIADELRGLAEDLSRRVERPIQGLVHGLRSGGVVDRLLGALETATAKLPAAVDLLAEPDIADLERARPTSGTPRTVEVREAARAFFDRRVAVRLAEHSRALETSADEALAGLRDASRLLRLRLGRDAGADDRERLTRETLDGVTERIAHEVAQTTETSAALLIELAGTDGRAVSELWAHLQSLAHQPALDQAVVGLRRLASVAATRVAEDPRVVRVRAALKLVDQRLAATRLAVEARADETIGGVGQLRGAMVSLDVATADVPYVYGKLFSLDATENDAFVVGREREIALLRQRLSAPGHGAVMLLGERGSGRSSVVRVALAGRALDRPVLWLDADAPIMDGDSLCAWIGQAMSLDTEACGDADIVGAELRRRAPVIVLDGLERIIERTAGGLEVLQALEALILSTTETALWLATAETAAWPVLCEVGAIEDYFDLVVRLGPLPEQALREAITRRHRLGGLELTWPRPSPLDPRGWPAALARRSPADQVFRRLTEVSGGRPRTALQLWLLSLQRLDERSVVASPCPALALPELRELPEHLMPVLHLLLCHGRVDREQVARTLGWTTMASKAALHTLKAAALIEGRPWRDGAMAWALQLSALGVVERELERRGLRAPVGRETP